MKMFCERGLNYYRYLCILKLSSILALAVFTYNCDVFFYFYCFLGTLDRFPCGDRMKALHFLGIFMLALRLHQGESVVRFVAAELFLNQVRYFLVPLLDRVSDFNI